MIVEPPTPDYVDIITTRLRGLRLDEYFLLNAHLVLIFDRDVRHSFICNCNRQIEIAIPGDLNALAKLWQLNCFGDVDWLDLVAKVYPDYV